jgi:hypothetical protein
VYRLLKLDVIFITSSSIWVNFFLWWIWTHSTSILHTPWLFLAGRNHPCLLFWRPIITLLKTVTSFLIPLPTVHTVSRPIKCNYFYTFVWSNWEEKNCLIIYCFKKIFASIAKTSGIFVEISSNNEWEEVERRGRKNHRKRQTDICAFSFLFFFLYVLFHLAECTDEVQLLKSLYFVF